MLGLGQLSFDLAPIRREKAQTRTGVSIMAKRKKASKAQKREKLPRGTSAKLRKARKAAPAKRTVAKAKPKRSPVKKAARKVKQPVTPVVETVAVEVIEQPAPGVITVTEVEETPGSGLQRALKRMNPNRQSSRGSTPGD
jgi:hypothetical protein